MAFFQKRRNQDDIYETSKVEEDSDSGSDSSSSDEDQEEIEEFKHFAFSQKFLDNTPTDRRTLGKLSKMIRTADADELDGMIDLLTKVFLANSGKPGKEEVLRKCIIIILRLDIEYQIEFSAATGHKFSVKEAGPRIPLLIEADVADLQDFLPAFTDTVVGGNKKISRSNILRCTSALISCGIYPRENTALTAGIILEAFKKGQPGKYIRKAGFVVVPREELARQIYSLLTSKDYQKNVGVMEFLPMKNSLMEYFPELEGFISELERCYQVFSSCSSESIDFVLDPENKEIVENMIKKDISDENYGAIVFLAENRVLTPGYLIKIALAQKNNIRLIQLASKLFKIFGFAIFKELPSDKIAIEKVMLCTVLVKKHQMEAEQMKEVLKPHQYKYALARLAADEIVSKLFDTI